MPIYSVRSINESVAAATAETLLQIVAPTNARVAIKEWGISFNGVTAADAPVDVDIMRQTTAGTASAFTPLKFDPDAPAARSTALTLFTAEPTASDILMTYQVTPTGGLFVIQYPEGDEPIVVNGGRFALRVTAAQVQVATAYMLFKE